MTPIENRDNGGVFREALPCNNLTISAFQIFEKYPDTESARLYLSAVRKGQALQQTEPYRRRAVRQGCRTWNEGARRAHDCRHPQGSLAVDRPSACPFRFGYLHGRQPFLQRGCQPSLERQPPCQGLCHGEAHTNRMESVWAVLKRGLYGTGHPVSEKHLGCHVIEAALRRNEANCEVHTLGRLASFAERVFRARISDHE